MFSAANDILPPLVPSLRPTPPPRPQHPNETPRNGKIHAPCVIRRVRVAKRGSSWQDIRAVYPPAAICGAFRIHGAHILPKPAHFGYIARESCQEGAFFPSEAPFGIHGAQNLPRIAARERTVASRSWEAPRERNVDQFNNVRRRVQETVKIFWCLPPRNCAENMLAYYGEHERKRHLHQQHQRHGRAR